MKITLERIRELLDYNPATGEMRWKARPARNSRRRAGDIAGCAKLICGERHRYVKLDGVEYQAAQLAWFMVAGAWPDIRLTAVNGDRTDLRFQNLTKQTKTVDPEHRRNYELRRSFGITAAQYDAMQAEQNGVCACCEQPERSVRNGRVKMLAVDHDHVTGAIRGLLCSNCNPMLGHAGDSIDILQKGAAYLERHAIKKLSGDNVLRFAKKEA